MDGVLQIGVLLMSLGGVVHSGQPAGIAVPGAPAAPAPPAPSPVVALTLVTTQMDAEFTQPSDRWPGEDKFRHAGASWAAMVFTYAAARAVHDDSGTAIAVALPVTAALGVAKEFIDRRRGGPFSAGDLVADALGAGVAWLVLREVR